MSGFDFLFALFSLLLGLAMAEVLGGFARVMKIHAKARAGRGGDVRVGRLLPLLAVFVLLGQLSFWHITYRVRDELPFNYVTLVGVTAIVGGYYLLSALVWPEEPAEWPDFDAYYDQHNRFILVGNLLLTLAGIAVGIIFAPPPGSDAQLTDPTLINVAVICVYGALLINLVVIFVRRRWLNVALLATLIVAQLGGALALAVAGVP
ncbi:MAG: hypothetical protein ACTHM8_01285 [Sphingomonas sp.]